MPRVDFRRGRYCRRRLPSFLSAESLTGEHEAVEPDPRHGPPPPPPETPPPMSLRDLFLSDLPPGDTSALDKAKAGGSAMIFGAAVGALLHALTLALSGLAISTPNQFWAAAFAAGAWLCGHLALLHFNGPDPIAPPD